MKEIAIKTNRLTKRYKKFAALDQADLTVYRGDICGIIGRNGAGKTTLMKMLTGLTNVTEGEYEIFSKKGKQAEAERNRIGCLIENPAFFSNMTAYQNLKYYCLQKGIRDLGKITEALELVDLSGAADKKFKSFSLGMKQRLGIALAILDEPELVILDEPINGLDPIGISQLRDTFHRLNRDKGLTLMISSHILSELYAVANRFVFIDRGRVIKEVSKEELDEECTKCFVIRLQNADAAAPVLKDSLGISDYRIVSGNEIRIYSDQVPSSVINRTLIENGMEVSEIYESGITLEDYFKTLVGEE